MDAKRAALRMSEAISEMPDVDDENISGKHLAWMAAQIMEGNVRGEKAHRWLGYMQGVVVALGIRTFEDMKQLNKGCKSSR